MSGPTDGWDTSMLQAPLDSRDPGPVASGTVPSGQIAPWLMENVPEMFQLRGDAQTPWPSEAANIRTPIQEPGLLERELQIATLGAYQPKVGGGAVIPTQEVNPPILPAGLNIPPTLGPVGGNVLSTQPERGSLPALQKDVAASPGTIPGTYGLLSADPIDLAVTLLTGGAGGAAAAKSVEGGLLRDVGRYRLGSPSNIEEVASVLQQVAPKGLRPATATAEGVSDVVRTKLGMDTIRKARDQVQEGIASALNSITQANRVQAASGMPGNSAAVQAVPDLAAKFRTLVTETMPDLGDAAYNKLTGALRNTSGSGAILRTREAIYQDIQALLENNLPGAWEKYLASQAEYAQASTLGRLFSAGRKGAANAVDVLLDPQRLQRKAKTIQDELNQLSPELLKAIFRGGSPIVTDMPAMLPFNFWAGPAARTGMRIPGTIMAGPVGQVGSAIATGAGALGGALTGRAADVMGQLGLSGTLSYLNRTYNPYYNGPTP